MFNKVHKKSPLHNAGNRIVVNSPSAAATLNNPNRKVLDISSRSLEQNSQIFTLQQSPSSDSLLNKHISVLSQVGPVERKSIIKETDESLEHPNADFLKNIPSIVIGNSSSVNSQVTIKTTNKKASTTYII